MTKFGVIEYLDAENGEYYITYPPFYEFNSNCDVKESFIKFDAGSSQQKSKYQTVLHDLGR